jgi:uncharacterized protein YciI
MKHHNVFYKSGVMRSDPYYIHGLVPSYSIQEWTVVVKRA